MTIALTIPVTRSIKEARQVMLETSQLLKEDARRGHKAVIARASAPTTPPTAREVYFTYIGEAMDTGLTKREAMAELAGKRPDLHRAFVREEQKTRQDRDAREQQERSKARDRRNSR